MKLYLVRHGESTSNATLVYQSKETPLSQKGHSQAEIVAERFKTIPVEVIYSSDYTRAHQTAETISRKIGKQVITSIDLRELKRPKELIGLPYNHPEAVRIKQLMKEHMDDPGWHYSDEENWFDLMKRAHSFLDFIKTQKHHPVLVVTHGFMLSVLISTMMYDDELTIKEVLRWLTFNYMSNTGITVCEYTAWEEWKLITWNDHYHLGEVHWFDEKKVTEK